MLNQVIQALGLPPSAVVAPAAGGASGSAWRVRAGGVSYVLRLEASASLTDGRLAAMAAARSAGLPAPELVGRVSTADHDAVLLSWLPGTTLLDAMTRTPASAARWGTRTGEMQRRLHAIAAPPQLPSARFDAARPFNAGRDVPNVPDGGALLHLDWHPLNLLVEEQGDVISGIVDWDNARGGHPLLDLARTESILTLEPSLAFLSDDVRAILAAFSDAWADGYGPEARAIPAACRAWAGRVMLADLEPRYVETPDLLDPIRRWTEAWS